MMGLTILVPAKDEGSAIGATLRALPLRTLRLLGLRVEVLVLDGGSTDDTADIARAFGARVVPDGGRGKGLALRLVRPHLKHGHVVMVDADGTYAADALPRLIAPILYGDADVVMGRRVPQAGSMSALHRVGNVMLSVEAATLYASRCADLCTGLWAFRAGVFHQLPLQSSGFELEAEIFALSRRLGFRVADVPVDYLPRTGESKLSALRDGWRISRCLVSRRFATLSKPAAVPRAVPDDARPADARPVDARPADARPVDARPSEAMPRPSRAASKQLARSSRPAARSTRADRPSRSRPTQAEVRP
jgi:glycosyltransferase involved in cell wall biosynthesis